MKEVEVKFLGVDVDGLVSKLVGFGAEKVLDCRVDARYYDFADFRLRDSGCMLRLRSVGGVNELTYKRDLGGVCCKGYG